MSLDSLQLILASGSTARKTMMQNAGLKSKVIPAQIDEGKIIQNLQSEHYNAETITMELARQKALDISSKNLDCFVIGSDQTLVLDGQIMTKAKSKSEAIDKLKKLNGKTHILNSAVCVAKNNTIVFETLDIAQLTMRVIDDSFLHQYADQAGDTLTSCVGAYAIEGMGAWLFADIRGNHFTIMGMPLLPLLGYLRTQGFHP